MFSLSGLLGLLVQLLAKTFSNVVNEQLDEARDARTNRELGASQHAEASLVEAERQEDLAKAVDEHAKVAVDDPRDLRD